MSDTDAYNAREDAWLRTKRKELINVVDTYAAEARVDDWLKKKREELIDVSKRNRLLYFKASETATIKLVEPSLDTLFRALVLNSKTLQFYPLVPNEDLLDFEDEETASVQLPLLAAGPPALRADEVRSDLIETRLRRNLYSLRQKGRTSVAERGLVTLHIAFGFLEWTESEASTEKVRSPLLLAPLDLLRASSQSPYRLQLFEESLFLNPTLAYKLQQDGLTLPHLPELDHFDLEAYFADVAQIIKRHKGWSVVRESYIGLFTFPKIDIYNDDAWEAASQNGIVRAMAGDTSCVPPAPTDLPTDETIDYVVLPQETFQIVDADSSQQQAIQAARRGVSFVLQGPPGTGKSQTITNIIAESLAQNKKVLFVSEKMAALEVVHDRLAANGLGSFCLEAHSQKANKRHMVQELDTAIKGASVRVGNPPVNFANLQSARHDLNAYAESLHKEQTPSELTAFQVHGKLARLEAVPDLIFDMPAALSCTPEERHLLDTLLYQLQLSYDVLASCDTHPWRGILARSASLELQADIRGHFTTLTASLNQFHAQAQSLAAACGLSEPSGIAACDDLLALADLVVHTPLPPTDWFAPDALAPLIEEAQVYQASFENYTERRSKLLIWWTEQAFLLPHQPLIMRLSTQPQPLLERMRAGGKSATDLVIHHREALKTGFSQLSFLLEHLIQAAPTLARLCGMDAPEHLGGVTDLCALATLAARDPQPQADWFSRPRLAALKQEAQEAQERYTSYKQLREQIKTRYESSFFALDHGALLTRFTGAYASPLRVVNPAYYRDLRLVRAELKTPEKLRCEEAVRDLKAGRQAVEQETWIEARRQTHAQDFGRRYEALETDWAAILAAIEQCRQITDLCGAQVPSGFIRVMMQSGAMLKEVERTCTDVETTLRQAEQEFASLGRLLALDRLPLGDGILRTVNLPELRQWLDTLAVSVSDFSDAYDAALTCRKTGAPDETGCVARVLTMLQEANDLADIEAAIRADAARLERQFGHLFVGMNTQWEKVLAALDWTGKTRALFGVDGPPPAFVAVVSGQQAGVEQAKTLIAPVRVNRRYVQSGLDFLRNLFAAEAFEGEAFQTGGISLAQIALPTLVDWLQTRLNRLPELEDWLTFQRAYDVCAQAGMEGFVRACMRVRPSRDRLPQAFYKRFWALWLDAVRRQEPALDHFKGERHDESVRQFRSLDIQQIDAAKERLKRRLLQTSRDACQNPVLTKQRNLLQREINKIRRHKPPRQLFREIPDLLLALKPCLMMSPLSVAQFLDPAHFQFDLVVFDEASQIRSEDVIGAIVRGKQVIVVGDNKQLPPSRFFAAESAVNDNDDAEDEEEFAADLFESVLDECEAAQIHSEKLRWHYRSRCEALIAFSNHHFYKDALVTFPGPFTSEENGAERCVEFVYVPDGVYTRGSSAGFNRIEARRVAELIFKHFAQSPNLSLGVIAFSEAQMTAIDDEVRQRRKERPELDYLFAEKPFEKSCKRL